MIFNLQYVAKFGIASLLIRTTKSRRNLHNILDLWLLLALQLCLQVLDRLIRCWRLHAYNFNRGFPDHSFLTALEETQETQYMDICAKLITIRDGRKEGKNIAVFPVEGQLIIR